jgi:hypothetical protein
MGWYGLDRSGPGWGPVEGSCEHGDESSGSLKWWEVPERLHNWQLLRRGSAPWVSKQYITAQLNVLVQCFCFVQLNSLRSVEAEQEARGSLADQQWEMGESLLHAERLSPEFINFLIMIWQSNSRLVMRQPRRCFRRSQIGNFSIWLSGSSIKLIYSHLSACDSSSCYPPEYLSALKLSFPNVVAHQNFLLFFCYLHSSYISSPLYPRGCHNIDNINWRTFLFLVYFISNQNLQFCDLIPDVRGVMLFNDVTRPFPSGRFLLFLF